MRQVAILGIGQTVIDEHWDKSLREIAGEARFGARPMPAPKNRRVIRRQHAFPDVDGQNQLGTFIADWVGLWRQKPSRSKRACASAGQPSAPADGGRFSRA